MLNISIDDILGLIGKILQAFKDAFAWLGILVFPEEGEYDFPGSDQQPVEDLIDDAL